jgi:hypothetical protein
VAHHGLAEGWPLRERIGTGVKRLAALLLLLFSALPASAHPPWGIVADGAGRIYFSDLEQVWRIDPDGRLSLFRPGVEGVHVHELAIAPNGDLIGAQNDYDPATQIYGSGLWRRDPEGRESWLLPMTPAPLKGSGPSFDREGNSYLSAWMSNDDRRTMLFRRSPSGDVRLLFGDPAAAAHFRQATTVDLGGLILAPDGAVTFVDGTLVRKVAADGPASILYRGGAKAMLRGLALAPDGTLFVADLGERRLIAIAPGGEASIVYSAEPRWAPTGVALAGGRLLVLEAEEDPAYRSHLVRVVEVTDGKRRVIASPGAEPATAEPGGNGGAGTAVAAPVSGMAALVAAAAALLGIACLARRKARRR